MKLRGFVTLMLVLAAVTAVESSLLLKRSLIQPRLPEPCFTCRAEERPFAYPLIAFFGKVKDMIVRGLSTLAESRGKKLN